MRLLERQKANADTPLLRVKSILTDDVFGLWHVKEIIVNKDGQPFAFALDQEAFTSKDEAERHAQLRAERVLQQKLGEDVSDISWD
jgi:hypothetical protein